MAIITLNPPYPWTSLAMSYKESEAWRRPEVTELTSGWAETQTPVPQLGALHCQTSQLGRTGASDGLDSEVPVSQKWMSLPKSCPATQLDGPLATSPPKSQPPHLAQ